jgi:hypothetical protein
MSFLRSRRFSVNRLESDAVDMRAL